MHDVILGPEGVNKTSNPQLMFWGLPVPAWLQSWDGHTFVVKKLPCRA